MCFDFNKFNESLFLVGTEEGKIHLCSKAYAGQYLETYEGHYLAVYAVKWNTFHPRVFISCSANLLITPCRGPFGHLAASNSDLQSPASTCSSYASSRTS